MHHLLTVWSGLVWSCLVSSRLSHLYFPIFSFPFLLSDLHLHKFTYKLSFSLPLLCYHTFILSLSYFHFHAFILSYFHTFILSLSYFHTFILSLSYFPTITFILSYFTFIFSLSYFYSHTFSFILSFRSGQVKLALFE